MQLIKGEYFRYIDGVDYFDAHDADFKNLQTNKIVTHNSDYAVSDVLNLKTNRHIFDSNDQLIWFAQNVDINHPRIKPIPIGLENSEWFPGLKKAEKIERIRLEPHKKDKLCLAAFNPGTHPDRIKIYNYFSSQSWCTSSSRRNGEGFDDYLNDLASSTFCICPRGNGLDTHRIWEALYVKTIPIVEKSTNINFYAPIIVVDSFQSVTLSLLLDIIQELPEVNSENYFKMFDTPHLNFKFWKEYIKNYEN